MGKDAPRRMQACSCAGDVAETMKSLKVKSLEVGGHPSESICNPKLFRGALPPL